jgi:hypothetical protein
VSSTLLLFRLAPLTSRSHVYCFNHSTERQLQIVVGVRL